MARSDRLDSDDLAVYRAALLRELIPGAGVQVIASQDPISHGLTHVRISLTDSSQCWCCGCHQVDAAGRPVPLTGGPCVACQYCTPGHPSHTVGLQCSACGACSVLVAGDAPEPCDECGGPMTQAPAAET